MEYLDIRSLVKSVLMYSQMGSTKDPLSAEHFFVCYISSDRARKLPLPQYIKFAIEENTLLFSLNYGKLFPHL